MQTAPAPLASDDFRGERWAKLIQDADDTETEYEEAE